jgi:hypothetical protein
MRGKIVGISIWNLPIGAANALYSLAYAVLVVGAVLTGVSTIVLFWTSSIRDKFTSAEIAGLNKSAEDARLSYETLKKSNLELEQKLEVQRSITLGLQLKVLKLEPRSLSQAQIETLTTALVGPRLFRGFSVNISADSSCVDCGALSAQFDQVLTSIGATVSNSVLIGPSSRPPSGIGIAVRQASAGDGALVGEAFMAALKAAGIAFDVMPMTPGDPDQKDIEMLLVAVPG